MTAEPGLPPDPERKGRRAAGERKEMELEQIMKELGIDPELTGRALAAVNRREAESRGTEAFV